MCALFLEKGNSVVDSQMSKARHSSVVSPLLQIICIIVTSLVILLTVYIRIRNVKIEVLANDVQTITDQDREKFGLFPYPVTTGLFINQFQKFDIGKNDFLFSGSIWFILDPSIVSIHTIDDFELTRGEILYKSPPNTQMVGDKILVEYSIRAHITIPISYKSFPIGDHQLSITINHQSLSPGDITFVSGEEDFTISKNAKEEGWQEVNKTVRTGYITKELGLNKKTEQYYPAVMYAIDYSREDVRYLISILLPLLFMFFLSLFSLSASHSTAIGMANGVIAATLAYRFVIEAMTPDVGYFILTDYLFFLFLLLNFIIFIFVMMDVPPIKISKTQKIIFILALHGALIAACAYLFIIWS